MLIILSVLGLCGVTAGTSLLAGLRPVPGDRRSAVTVTVLIVLAASAFAAFLLAVRGPGAAFFAYSLIVPAGVVGWWLSRHGIPFVVIVPALAVGVCVLARGDAPGVVRIVAAVLIAVAIAAVVRLAVGPDGCGAFLMTMTALDVISWQAGLLDRLQIAATGEITMHSAAAIEIGPLLLGGGDLVAAALLAAFAFARVRAVHAAVITAVVQPLPPPTTIR